MVFLGSGEAVAIVAPLVYAKNWAIQEYKPDELHVMPSLEKVDDVRRFIELCGYAANGVKVCVAPVPPKKHQHRLLGVLEEGVSGVVVFSIGSISSMSAPFLSRLRLERAVFRSTENFYVDEYLEAKPEDRDFLRGVLEPLDFELVKAAFEERAGSVSPLVYFRMKEVLESLYESRSTTEFVLKVLWQ